MITIFKKFYIVYMFYGRARTVSGGEAGGPPVILSFNPIYGDFTVGYMAYNVSAGF